MRIGCLLDNAIKARSVTKGSGTNDESMNADNNKPGPPSAGSVDFSHNLNCAQSTAIIPLEQLLVGACVRCALLVFLCPISKIRPEPFIHVGYRIPSHL